MDSFLCRHNIHKWVYSTNKDTRQKAWSFNSSNKPQKLEDIEWVDQRICKRCSKHHFLASYTDYHCFSNYWWEDIETITEIHKCPWCKREYKRHEAECGYSNLFCSGVCGLMFFNNQREEANKPYKKRFDALKESK